MLVNGLSIEIDHLFWTRGTFNRNPPRPFAAGSSLNFERYSVTARSQSQRLDALGQVFRITAIRVVAAKQLFLAATMPCSQELDSLELQALQQRTVLWEGLVGLVRSRPIVSGFTLESSPGSASGRRPGRCDAGPALYRWRCCRLGGNCADL